MNKGSEVKITLTPFIMYIAAVNGLTLLLFSLDQLRRRRGRGRIPMGLLLTLCVIGGPFGAILAALFLDRKVTKENSAYRMFILMCCMIYGTVLLVLYGPNKAEARRILIRFYAANRMLCLYVLAVNVLALLLFGIDKLRALTQRRRIPEVVLLGLGVLGGALGEMIGMTIWNHKRHSPQFSEGIPQILAAQLFVLCCYAAGLI